MLSKSRKPNAGPPRRGMAVVLVLGVIAITLAVSYATLRGQGTTVELARNNSRAMQAREASRSGLAAAVRKMSDSTWSGVGVLLKANVTPDSWYEVTFTTGDSQLTPASTNYGEYPYRVTVDSFGYASDPLNPSVRSSYHCRCVLQLVRKAMGTEPTMWAKLTGSTIYQWGNRTIYVQEPVRVKGLATILGRVSLSGEYPLTTASRNRYLSDLLAMKTAGRGDYRPLNSPLNIALARQDATNLGLLQTNLGLTLVDTLDATTNPINPTGSVSSYQLYPGGTPYSPPQLNQYNGGQLQDMTFGPDPITNPLGVFRSPGGTLDVRDNVRITGTLITETTSSDVRIRGANVVWQGYALPKLQGSTTTYQLPTALVRDDLRIDPLSNFQLNGFTMVWDEFELKNGSPTTFTMQGNLATAGLLLRGRSNWTMTATDWNSDYNDYMGTGSILGILLQNLFNTIRSALGLPNGATVYFPEYEQYQRGFLYQPTLTFQPNSSGVQPHWQDWTQPIFVKAASDAGLCWDLIRSEDNL